MIKRVKARLHKIQSGFLSLENNLLHQVIRHNLMAEKTSKLLELVKSFVTLFGLQLKVDLEDLEKGKFGVSQGLKFFEQQIRMDLDLVSVGQRKIREELFSRTQLNDLMEEVSGL